MHDASVTHGDLRPREFRAMWADFEVVLEIWEGIHKVQESRKHELASGASVHPVSALGQKRPFYTLFIKIHCW